MEIVDNAIASHAPAPGGSRSFQALHVTPKRIFLHCRKCLLNVSLISWRELSEVFLGRSGEFEVPAHRGSSSMIPNPHGERRLSHGEGQQARL